MSTNIIPKSATVVAGDVSLLKEAQEVPLLNMDKEWGMFCVEIAHIAAIKKSFPSASKVVGGAAVAAELSFSKKQAKSFPSASKAVGGATQVAGEVSSVNAGGSANPPPSKKQLKLIAWRKQQALIRKSESTPGAVGHDAVSAAIKLSQETWRAMEATCESREDVTPGVANEARIYFSSMTDEPAATALIKMTDEQLLSLLFHESVTSGDIILAVVGTGFFNKACEHAIDWQKRNPRRNPLREHHYIIKGVLGDPGYMRELQAPRELLTKV